MKFERAISALCVVVLVFFLSDAVKADDAAKIVELEKQIAVMGVLLKEAQGPAFKAQTERRAAEHEYAKAYWQSQASIMKRNVELLTWQDEATKSIHVWIKWMLISAVVLAVVQIVFSFWYSPHGAGGVPNQDLELSATKLKITTNVTSFILLLIVFAFFYMYIKEVYTIKPLGFDQRALNVDVVPGSNVSPK